MPRQWRHCHIVYFSIYILCNRLNILSGPKKQCGISFCLNRGKEQWLPALEWHHYIICQGKCYICFIVYKCEYKCVFLLIQFYLVRSEWRMTCKPIIEKLHSNVHYVSFSRSYYFLLVYVLNKNKKYIFKFVVLSFWHFSTCFFWCVCFSEKYTYFTGDKFRNGYIGVIVITIFGDKCLPKIWYSSWTGEMPLIFDATFSI